MLAGRDVVGKEGLRTVRTKTFRGLRGREPLRTGRMKSIRTGRIRIYVVYFFTSVFLLPLLSLQELAF